MMQLAVFIFVLVAGTSAQRPFIHKCSLSDPNIEQCFIQNGNRAIEALKLGVSDLGIPALEEVTERNLLFSVRGELPFLFQDIKSYVAGLKLENARLRFGKDKSVLSGLDLYFSASDVYWKFKYTALGFVNLERIDEEGNAQINFGQTYGNYSTDFQSFEIDGVPHLRVHDQHAVLTVEKFEFVPSDVNNVGQPLQPQQYAELERLVVPRAEDISVQYVSFIFNQILEEIPIEEIFLP